MVCPKQSNPNKVDIWCQTDYTVSSIPGFYGDIPGLPPLGDFVIKNGVASLNNATERSGGNRVVTLPSDVKEVADKGFYKASVVKLDLNDGLQKIGVGAFCGNELLFQVEIPASVKEIGRLAFMACNLRKVDLKCKLSKLPERCFAWNENIDLFTGLENVPVNGIDPSAFDDSKVTFVLDENDTEHIEFANKIGAKVINRNGELING